MQILNLYSGIGGNRRLWGDNLIDRDEKIGEYEFYRVCLEAWKYHLQNMILSDHPLAYVSAYV